MEKYLLSHQRFIFMILLNFMVSSCIFGQTEHMKFMGIPINGHINSFKEKIIKKGFKDDSYNINVNPVGCKIFNGPFFGRKTILYIYYNDKTKIVYRVKVLFLTSNSDVTNQLYKELEKSLDSKYPSYIKIEKDFKGRKTLHYLREPDIGEIHLFRDYLNDKLSLFVDYYDYSNTRKNENKNSDDL